VARGLLGGGLAPEVGQLVGVELGQLGQIGEHLAPQHAWGQRAPQRPGIAGHVCAAFGCAQVAAFAGGFNQEAAQRNGIANVAGKGVGAMCAHKAVGVVLGWQEQKLDAARVAGMGQGAVKCLARCPAAGGVAIEN